MNNTQIDKIVKELQSTVDRIDSLMRNVGLFPVYPKKPKKCKRFEARLTAQERWLFKHRLFWKYGGAECVYCRKQMPLEHLTIDHVQPRTKGGAMRDVGNMVLACTACNWEKSNQWFYSTEG